MMLKRLMVFLFLLCAPVTAWAQIPSLLSSTKPAADTQSADPAAVKELLRILQDDNARNTIIDAIKAAEAPSDAVSVDQGTPHDKARTQVPPTVEQIIYDEIQNITAWWTSKIGEFKSGLERLWASIFGLGTLLGAPRFWTGLAYCIPLAIAALGGYGIIASRCARWLGGAEYGKNTTITRFTQQILFAALTSISIVLATWLAGIALDQLDYVRDHPRVARSFQSASVVFAVCMFFLNLIPHHRLDFRNPIPDAPENVSYDTVRRWLAVTLGFVIYGQIWFIAVAKYTAGLRQGQYLYTLLSLSALIWVAYSAYHYRQKIQIWLTSAASERVRRRGSLVFSHWYLLAFAYCGWLALVAMIQPGNALPPILIASAKVVAIIVTTILILRALGRMSRRGIILPPEIQNRFPKLAHRLEGLLRSVLIILRTIIVFVALFMALEIINLPFFDPSAMAIRIGHTVGNIERIIAIFVITSLIWIGFNSWAEFFVDTNVNPRSTARQRTLLTLFRNVINIVLFVISGMLILSELGVNIAPLLASAGVLGLAVGFGAQRLVQDVITGVFIQIEDVMQIGDVVTLGNITGTVEKLTIRSVSLRDKEGNFHLIAFSQTDTITNYQRDFAYAFLEIAVDYREDLEKVEKAMREAFMATQCDPTVTSSILDDLTWFGVQEYNDARMIVRVRIKTRAGDQWMVRRAYNAAVKQSFEKNKIRIGSPISRVVYEKDAAALRKDSP